jgi:hypothetical protein
MNKTVNSFDLFPTASLPLFQENETLYSWCGRYHQLSCNSSERYTSRQLFRHPSSGFHADFPTPTCHIQANLRNQLAAIDFIKSRTMYGFYFPFLPLSRANSLALAIENGPYAHVSHQLGLSASLPECSTLLKACPMCLDEDFINLSYSWWRIQNQWPSTLVCTLHQHPLIYVSTLRGAEKLQGWILPRGCKSDGFWKELPINEYMLRRMIEISNWGHSVVTKPNISLETHKLRYCYLLQAKKHGFVAMDGSVKLINLRNKLLEWLGDCVQLPSLNFARYIQDLNGGFIGQLLRQYPGNRHPLKHILMIAFLFPKPHDFFELYEYVSSIYNFDENRQLRDKLKNAQGALINLVSNENKSVNSAAAELGVSVTQAIKLLKKTRTPYQTRPRIVGSEKEKEVSQALFAGEDRAHICQKYNVRKSFIKDYLAAHPLLKSHWERKHKIKLIKSYRKRFLSIVKANPGVPVKKLKGIPGNGIQWLQKYDKCWLENNLPNLKVQPLR